MDLNLIITFATKINNLIENMKLSIKPLLSLIMTMAVVLVASSCGDDEPAGPTGTAPTVTVPTGTTASVGTPITVSFTLTVPGGYFDSSAEGVGGTAGSTSGMQAGETSGVISVEFTPNQGGAGAVVLEVVDNDNNSTRATALITIEGEQTEFTVNGNITADVTWETGNTYILASRVTVTSGVTLTIEPGVVVKGEVGSGANATALLIARGATLNANGTAASPIIFTTVADEIQPGQIASPNLTPDVSGLWGGLIVLGYAPISADAEAVQIEGIPPSDTNGLYGGTDSEDNSGSIRYISIRHGGANIGEGNEINGLTLGGVGSGTTIEYVEIIGNQDDGIEPFGGTVDVTNLLVWNAGDDSFDCDQAYSGTINNFIGILGNDSDHGLELDGPEGSADGSYTLMNGSIKGKGAGSTSGGEYGDLRSDAKCTLNNIYFFNFSEGSDLELDNNGVANNYLNSEITMTNLQFNVSHLTEGNRTIADIILEKTGDNETSLDIFTQMPLPSSVAVVTTPTVGADKTAFASWTWADTAGELADFN